MISYLIIMLCFILLKVCTGHLLFQKLINVIIIIWQNTIEERYMYLCFLHALDSIPETHNYYCSSKSVKGGNRSNKMYLL